MSEQEQRVDIQKARIVRERKRLAGATHIHVIEFTVVALADERDALKIKLSKMEGALAEYYRSESRATISVDSYRLAREAAEALAGE